MDTIERILDPTNPELESEFTKRIEFQPAYDKRDPDPKKNYGIHGVTMRFILIGPAGATQFVFYSGIFPKHIYAERAGQPSARYCPWMGADIGHHWPTPQYPDQPEMDCDLLESGRCYYDGSSLAAQDLAERFVNEGEAPVWKALHARYASLQEDTSC